MVRSAINAFLGAETAYRELVKALCCSIPAGNENKKVHLEKREKKKRLRMEINEFEEKSSMARNVIKLLILS